MLEEGKQIREEKYLYLKEKYEGVFPSLWSIQEISQASYSFQEAEKQFNELQQYVRVEQSDQILDLGCGFGHFVSNLLAKGYNCAGCEVDPTLAGIAKQLLARNKQELERIKLADSNRLPFEDNYFDLINLHFVLDYIADIHSLFKELKRILKDNGKIFIIGYNHQCYYSPFYALFFIPWLPKSLNKIYLKLMGRANTKFLDSLTFTTPKYCQRVFARLGFRVKNLGLDAWDRLLLDNCLEDRSNFLKLLIFSSKKMKLTWAFRLLAKAGFYTPLVYVLKKA